MILYNADYFFCTPSRPKRQVRTPYSSGVRAFTGIYTSDHLLGQMGLIKSPPNIAL
jgi:hypothetical protein